MNTRSFNIIQIVLNTMSLPVVKYYKVVFSQQNFLQTAFETRPLGS